MRPFLGKRYFIGPSVTFMQLPDSAAIFDWDIAQFTHMVHSHHSHIHHDR